MTTNITEMFQEIEAKGAQLTLQITATISNLHGQVSERRWQKISKHSYSEVATETVEKGVTGSKQHSSEEEAIVKSGKVKESIEQVATFPKSDNELLMAPIGGRYGYIMGALTTSVTKKFGDTSKKTSPAYGAKGKLEIGTLITPEYIEIGKEISNPLDKPLEYFILNRNVFTYFDYVKESQPFTFTISADSGLTEEIFLHLLAFIQRVGLGPKRRGLLKISKVERI